MIPRTAVFGILKHQNNLYMSCFPKQCTLPFYLMMVTKKALWNSYHLMHTLYVDRTFRSTMWQLQNVDKEFPKPLETFHLDNADKDLLISRTPLLEVLIAIYLRNQTHNLGKLILFNCHGIITKLLPPRAMKCVKYNIK